MDYSKASTTSTVIEEGAVGVAESGMLSYSTLEVHNERFIDNGWHAAPSATLENVSDKIIYYDQGCHKEMVVTCEPESVAPPTDLENSEPRGFIKTIFGSSRKRFIICLCCLLLVVLAAGIGGGVGGTVVARRNKASASVPRNSTSTNSTANPSRTVPILANTGLAAMQWTDPNGTLHKRVYHQGNDNVIRESGWSNNSDFSASWSTQQISDAAKPGTPIAATAGWPHASQNYTLVKNVYYMNNNTELVERQAKASDPSSWEDDNFTGLFRGSNSTFLSAYWGQNIWNSSQELVVLFQRDNFENGITQAKYTSDTNSSNPWVANNFPFAQPKASTFAMSLVSYRSGKHLMLYTVGDKGVLGQNEYTINDNVDSTSLVALTSQSSTPVTMDSRASLAVVAQDNQPLFSTDKLPQCFQNTPLTNLIIHTTADRRSLKLNSWNCTAGFLDQTDEILPLQKPNTTFLALAAMSDRATGDGDLYVMFDSGNGTEIEEWTVPKRAGDPWTVSRKVDL